MAMKDVLGLTVELEAETSKFVKDLQKAAGKFRINGDMTDLIRGFGRAQGKIQKQFSDTIAAAATQGFGKTNLKGFVDKLRPLTEQVESSMKRVFDLQVASRRKGLSEAEKKQQEGLLKQEQIRLKGLDEQFKQEVKNTDRLMARRKKAMEAAQRILDKEHMAKTIKAGNAFGDSISSAFGKVRSGDLGGLLQGLGGGMGKAGKGMAKKGKESGGGGALTAIGGMLTMLGPGIAAIGAIAAGFAAVVAILVSADSAMKDLNRTLMDAGISGMDLVDEFGMMGDRLNQVRKTFTDFDFNNLWGTTAKDNLQILGSFSDAGVSFKKMADGVREAGNEMMRLRDYSMTVLTYSKILGASTQDISTQMASYMEELGFSLEGIQQRYSGITMAAKESGFATKRFLSMLYQATSGMSMYNVRIEEAAGLLIQLGKVLGQKMGGEMLQDLVKGFRDLGTQDRILKAMKIGPSVVNSVAQKDTIFAAEEFQNKMATWAASKDSSPAQVSLLRKVLKDAGLDQGPEGFAKALSKMTTTEVANLQFKMQASGNPGLSRMIPSMYKGSMGFKGTRGGAAAALGGVGAGATLFLRLNAALRNTGKSLEQIPIDAEELNMAFESLAGETGQSVDKLREMGGAMRAAFLMIQDVKSGKVTEKDANVFLKEFGVAMENGRAFRATFDDSGLPVLGKEIGDQLQDVFIGLGSQFKPDETQIAQDILLAQEIASNTDDISNILERTIQSWLQDIYDVILDIKAFFGVGLDADQRKAKVKAQAEMAEEIRATREQKTKVFGEMKELERSIPKLSGAEKKDAETSLAAKQGVLAALQSREVVQRKGLREISNIREVAEGNTKEQSLDPKTYKNEGMGSAGTLLTAAKEIEKLTGEDLAGPAASKIAESNMQYWTGKTTPGQHAEDVISTQSELASAMSNVLGLGSSYGGGWFKGRTSSGLSMGSANTGLQPTMDRFSPTLTQEGLSAKDFSKETEVSVREQKRIDDERAKKGVEVEKEQKKESDKRLIDAWKDVVATEEEKTLGLALANSGVGGGSDEILTMSKRLMGGDITGVNLTEMVTDPETGLKVRRGDLLRKKAGLRGAVAIQNKIGAVQAGKPAAQDFLMQIGSGGRVKFAQRIDKADTVTALASKGTGAVQSAGSRSGGGGSSVVINSFGNAAEVIRGIQAAIAAGAL